MKRSYDGKGSDPKKYLYISTTQEANWATIRNNYQQCSVWSFDSIFKSERGSRKEMSGRLVRNVEEILWNKVNNKS